MARKFKKVHDNNGGFPIIRGLSRKGGEKTEAHEHKVQIGILKIWGAHCVDRVDKGEGEIIHSKNEKNSRLDDCIKHQRSQQ